MTTTFIFAGAITIDGTPVNQKRFSNGQAANKYKEKTETRKGFWSKVSQEKLAATFKDSVVYVWKEDNVQRLEDVLM